MVDEDEIDKRVDNIRDEFQRYVRETDDGVHVGVGGDTVDSREELVNKLITQSGMSKETAERRADEIMDEVGSTFAGAEEATLGLAEEAAHQAWGFTRRVLFPGVLVFLPVVLVLFQFDFVSAGTVAAALTISAGVGAIYWEYADIQLTSGGGGWSPTWLQGIGAALIALGAVGLWVGTTGFVLIFMLTLLGGFAVAVTQWRGGFEKAGAKSSVVGFVWLGTAASAGIVLYVFNFPMNLIWISLGLGIAVDAYGGFLHNKYFGLGIFPFWALTTGNAVLQFLAGDFANLDFASMAVTSLLTTYYMLPVGANGFRQTWNALRSIMEFMTQGGKLGVMPASLEVLAAFELFALLPLAIGYPMLPFAIPLLTPQRVWDALFILVALNGPLALHWFLRAENEGVFDKYDRGMDSAGETREWAQTEEVEDVEVEEMEDVEFEEVDRTEFEVLDEKDLRERVDEIGTELEELNEERETVYEEYETLRAEQGDGSPAAQQKLEQLRELDAEIEALERKHKDLIWRLREK